MKKYLLNVKGICGIRYCMEKAEHKHKWVLPLRSWDKVVLIAFCSRCYMVNFCVTRDWNGVITWAVQDIIFYERNGNVSLNVIQICDSLSHNVILLRIIEEWYQKFRSGDLTFENAHSCGTSTVVNDLNQTLEDNNSNTSHKLGAQFKVHHTTIINALKCINLAYKFICWVP